MTRKLHPGSQLILQLGRTQNCSISNGKYLYIHALDLNLPLDQPNPITHYTPQFVSSGLHWPTGAPLSGSAAVPRDTLPWGHSGLFGGQPSERLRLKQNLGEHRG